MAVVTDGFNRATNLRTRSPDEIAAQAGRPFGVPTFSGADTSTPTSSSGLRRFVSKLGFGGGRSQIATDALGLPGSVNNVKFNNSGSTSNGSTNDWRVRISVAPTSGILYRAEGDSGILSILKFTDGVIFPYVPSLTVTHNARYGTQQLTHSNYTSYFYESSEVQSISINADFTIQNSADATYILAALYFFRAATKMFYGQSGTYQGAPPPIVYLDGYGSYYLPHVPCVITSFSHTMPNDVDYVEVVTNKQGESRTTASAAPGSANSGGVGIKLPAVARTSATGDSITTTNSISLPTRLPTSSTFNLTLQPVYSRAKQRTFDYQSFARGDMIIGGML